MTSLWRTRLLIYAHAFWTCHIYLSSSERLPTPTTSAPPPIKIHLSPPTNNNLSYFRPNLTLTPLSPHSHPLKWHHFPNFIRVGRQFKGHRRWVKFSIFLIIASLNSWERGAEMWRKLWSGMLWGRMTLVWRRSETIESWILNIYVDLKWEKECC